MNPRPIIATPPAAAARPATGAPLAGAPATPAAASRAQRAGFTAVPGRALAGRTGAAIALVAGLTLIELLVVVVLALVLLGAAAPSFTDALQRMRLQAAVNDLQAGIDLTRSQAIARGGKVLMAPLEASGVNWQSGWAIFIDHNGNRRPDAGEPLLYRHDPLRNDISITSKFTSGNAPSYIAYNAAGRTCSAASSLTARWGALSLKQGEHARKIIINMLGRVRVCDPGPDGEGCSGAAE
ncbi:GspH/FimT family pseudopilin [Duganella sp. P38]|uniref:GspH/FimT family pseudopilin n=1 Tax=Duganella sp. P38 TaxID=3423949 RepID=UPI003D7A6602